MQSIPQNASSLFFKIDEQSLIPVPCPVVKLVPFTHVSEALQHPLTPSHIIGTIPISLQHHKEEVRTVPYSILRKTT